MKVLLVHPPCGPRTIGLRHIAKMEPLGLETVGAGVSSRHDVRLIDMMVWPGDLLRTLKRFTPDVALEEGMDLSPYGFDAQVLSLPGHSRGSAGILTAEGDLFCGDLFSNVKGPALNDLMDDPAAGQASVDRLQRLGVRTVYPGHGTPFRMEAFPGQG